MNDEPIDTFIDELKDIIVPIEKIENNIFNIGGIIVGIDQDSKNDLDILIHSDLLIRRREQVKARLVSKLGLNEYRIHGRRTNIVKVSRKKAEKFVNENHILGFGGGHSFYGLKYNNELVAIAIFSKPLLMKYENPPYTSAEMERFCSKQGCTVIGGLDKLIKAFIKNNEVDDIITYVDKEWSNGESFQKLGFKVIGETPPIEFAIDPSNNERSRIKSNKSLPENSMKVRNQGNIKLQLDLRKV